MNPLDEMFLVRKPDVGLSNVPNDPTPNRSLRRQVEIVNGYLLWLWGITWVGGGLVAYGVDVWWSIETGAEAITRIVFLWMAVITALMVWSVWTKLLKLRDIPILIVTPLMAPSIATLLLLSVPVTDN